MKIPGGFDSIRQCLHIRDYRLYVIGNVAHGLGVWILRMSMGWLAWEMTKSTAWLGGIVMAEMVPSLVLGLFAGTLVDRVNYFRLMRITQGLAMVFAATLAVLTLMGLMNIWLLFGLTMFRGCLMAFNRPSRGALIHHLVGRDLLAPALAIGSITHNGTRFIGPAIGGLIIVGAGTGGGFATTAGMLLFYSIILGVMHADTTPRKRQTRSVISETREGLAYLKSHRGIRMQLVLLIIMGIIAKPVTDLLPGFAGQVFERGADGLAMLLSAHGIGATCGAVWLASRPSGIEGLTRISLLSVLFLALLLMAFAATDVFYLGVFFIALLGFGFITLNVSSQTLIQSAVEPNFRGRVISVHGMVMLGVPAFGALSLGLVADYIGLRLPVLIGGAICIFVWLAVWSQRKTLESSLETPPVSQ